MPCISDKRIKRGFIREIERDFTTSALTKHVPSERIQFEVETIAMEFKWTLEASKESLFAFLGFI